jgi:lipopolysaccharide export system protein LptC
LWRTIVLALIATLSAWHLLSEAPTPLLDVDPNKRTADYFMEEFTLTSIGADGLPSYRLTGTHMAHYPDNDTLEITAPYAVFYTQAAIRWKVLAEQGLTNSKGDEIYLLGKVRIRHFETDPVTPTMKILTRDVRVEPAVKFAETDQPVTLINGFGQTDAVGARVYLQAGLIELLSQVKGSYEAQRTP